MKKILLFSISLCFITSAYSYTLPAGACQAQINRKNTICEQYKQAKSKPKSEPSTACKNKARARAERMCRRGRHRAVNSNCVASRYPRFVKMYCGRSRRSRRGSSLRRKCMSAKRSYLRCKRSHMRRRRYKRR